MTETVYFPNFHLVELGFSNRSSRSDNFYLMVQNGILVLLSPKGILFSLEVPEDPASDLIFLEAIKSRIWSTFSMETAAAVLEIEISSIDRYTVGLIAGLIIRSNLLTEIIFTYKMAEYYFKGVDLKIALQQQELREYVNDRDTEIASVPFSEGKHRPSTYKFFAHTFGFDFFRTSNLLREYEPRQVTSIGSPSPHWNGVDGKSVDPEHQSIQIGDVCKLINELRLWKAGVPDEIHNKATQSIIFASGWKTHIIATIIWSVLEAEVPVFVPVPDAVIPIERRENGKTLRFSLRRNSLLGDRPT